MTSQIRSVLFSTAVAIAAVFSMVPAVASAQSATCGWFWGINSQACGQGTVLTYVQVMNRDTTHYVPSNFIVDAQGQNPSLASFPGSLQGTLITLTAGGTYSMVLHNTLGFPTQYSTGCNGTVLPNQQALCVVTVSVGSAYSAQPTPYPYPYSILPLTCTPQYQNVAAGATATFVALGGSGTYNWATIERTTLGSGPVLNTAFGLRGAQAVTVTSGSQTATCTVDVGGTGPITFGTPNTNNYTGTNYAVSTNYPVTAFSYTAQPALPNTGFAPLTAAQEATALVVLMVVGLLASPYVRKLYSLVTA